MNKILLQLSMIAIAMGVSSCYAADRPAAGDVAVEQTLAQRIVPMSEYTKEFKENISQLIRFNKEKLNKLNPLLIKQLYDAIQRDNEENVLKVINEMKGQDNKEMQDILNGSLCQATRNNNINSLLFLIKSGADINAQDNSGQTPLHIATENNSKEILELLISKDADIKAQDNDGQTPLHLPLSIIAKR